MSENENPNTNEQPTTTPEPEIQPENGNDTPKEDASKQPALDPQIVAKRRKYIIIGVVFLLIYLIFKGYNMFVTPNPITDYMGSQMGDLNRGVNYLIIAILAACAYRYATCASTKAKDKDSQ